MAGKRNRATEQGRKKQRGRQETRKYGQTVLKHSHMGAHSCEYAAGALLLFFLALAAAFQEHGKAAGFIGGLGICSMMLSVFGIRAGVKGLQEREKKYILCRLGIAVNILLLLCLLTIFIGGLT